MSILERGRRLLLAKNPTKGQRIVALAVRKGKVVGVGFNSYSKSHAKQRRFARIAQQPKKEYLHAEVAALLHCSVIPDKLYVVRLNRSGEPCLAKPCPVCSIAIRLVNPRMRIVHT